MSLDAAAARSLVDATWEASIVPALHDYVAIPAVSPAFDAGWAAAGHIDAAVDFVSAWCAARPIEGLSVSVERLAGRTPLIVAEVPAHGRPDDGPTVMLYGHLDKQPPMTGWREGLGPWTPVVRDGRLYGRGGADDGYSAFASLTAIEAVHAAGGTHPRCVVVIEASEESGSPDLPAHVDALGDRVGDPALVVCLDSGCADYERLWVTTSLRGVATIVLRVDVLAEGVHSGAAGGVVPSSFRVLRALLDRVEDPATGRIVLTDLHVDVPPERAAQLVTTGTEIGPATFPYIDGVEAQVTDPVAERRARTWEPAMEVIGMDGFPPVGEAGNVLRPSTTAMLSFRLPPTTDPQAATTAIEQALRADPPHGARVDVKTLAAEGGWNAPPTAPWLGEAATAASEVAFERAAGHLGEGGTIPFMGMLGRRFPGAQFLVTGVLGPGSNAHGPNEFLDLDTARRLTLAVASVLDAVP